MEPLNNLMIFPLRKISEKQLEIREELTMKDNKGKQTKKLLTLIRTHTYWDDYCEKK